MCSPFWITTDDVFGLGMHWEKNRIVGDISITELDRTQSLSLAWYPGIFRFSQKMTKHFWEVHVGDHKAQQTSECLNLLVALRNWKKRWTIERVCLEVRADNITALKSPW